MRFTPILAFYRSGRLSVKSWPSVYPPDSAIRCGREDPLRKNSVPHDPDKRTIKTDQHRAETPSGGRPEATSFAGSLDKHRKMTARLGDDSRGTSTPKVANGDCGNRE